MYNTGSNPDLKNAGPFSLTLRLCFTPDELGSLDENGLRFWRRSGNTWMQVGGTPALTTINGNRCATLSGITELSIWTLATAQPTVVMLRTFAAIVPSAQVWGLVALLGLVCLTVILKRRARGVVA